MASAVFAFVPQAGTGLFQFQPTFDGQAYTCVIYWNLAGQRYFIACVTLNGELVYNRALIGSPLEFSINLNWGYFTSGLVFRVPTSTFEVIG